MGSSDGNGQTVKLCGDVAMQLDIPDDQRGEVFAIQDAVFNLTFVVAVTVAALGVPDDGRAVGSGSYSGASYAAALLGVVRRHPHRRTCRDSGTPSVTHRAQLGGKPVEV